jgi:hypothetical protein
LVWVCSGSGELLIIGGLHSLLVVRCGFSLFRGEQALERSDV